MSSASSNACLPMQYQVGGSLQSQAPSYIVRAADESLYQALLQGEFCYVLNSRQMGKSSLLVQTRARLTQAGFRCTTLDLTNIGSENITPLQWYKGIVKDLWRSFKLMRQVPINDWWKDEADVSLLQRLSYFISDVLLKQFPEEEIVIFIDEVDSVLSLPFSADDFFALIRFCYNQRATNPAYKRIRFAIFGVASPSDLIRDRSRTPFNLGTAIELQGFTPLEAMPLAEGLEVQGGDRQSILQAILHWTGGQPFLTQKICQLAISEGISGQFLVMPGNEVHWVEQLIQTHVLTEWESQDEPEHLRTIRNRLLSNPETVGRLLSVYQQVLLGQTVTSNDSYEQAELLLSGIVVKRNGQLEVRNPIYDRIFNPVWVEQQLSELRPYAQVLEIWQASGQTDESRLLRGQALKDAQVWAMGKRLSDEDYKFLAASVESERQALAKTAEAERVQQQLVQEQQAAKVQRRFSLVLGAALVIMAGLGGLTLWQFRKTQLNEIGAIATAAEGHFQSHHQLTALEEIVMAQSKLGRLPFPPEVLAAQVRQTLQLILDGSQARNQLNFDSEVHSLSIHPQGELVAVVTSDRKLSFWLPNGQPAPIALTLEPELQVRRALFSPDGIHIALALAGHEIQLWSLTGERLQRFTQQSQFSYWAFAPDGKSLLLRSNETLQKLDLAKNELTSLSGDTSIGASALSADGSLIAGAYRLPPPGSSQAGPNARPGRRGGPRPVGLSGLGGQRGRGQPGEQPSEGPAFRRPNVQLWNQSGQKLNTLETNGGPVFAVALSPQGDLVATSHVDGEIRLTRPNGELAQELFGVQGKINYLAFSPDGQLLAAADVDGGIHLWTVGGSRLMSLLGHQGKLRELLFNPDGSQLISASQDGTVRFWDTVHPYQTTLAGHTDVIMNLYYSPDGQQLHSFGVDQRQQVWQRNGQNEFALTPAETKVMSVGSRMMVSRDRQTLLRVMRSKGTVLSDGDGNNSIEVPGATANGGMEAAVSPSGDRVIAVRQGKGLLLMERDGEGQFQLEPEVILPQVTNAKSVAWMVDEGGLIVGYQSGRAELRYGLGDEPAIAMIDPKLEGERAHQSPVSFMTSSPDGRWVATASKDRVIKIWDREGQLVQRLEDHQASVRAVTFSPDSSRLASVSPDSTLKLWQVGELANGEKPLLRTLTGHRGEVNAVAFSPDGLEVATAGSDRRVVVWKLQEILALDELEMVCERVGDYLRNSPQVEDEARSLCN